MVQLQVLNKLLDTQDASILLNNNLNGDYFSDYRNEFDFILDHFNTYGNIPSKSTFLSRFPNFSAIKVDEPDDYLIKALHQDKAAKLINEAFLKMRSKILDGNIEEAKKIYSDYNDKLIGAEAVKSVDILQNVNERYDNYLEKCNDFKGAYVTTGLRELDEIIGGWDRHEELATIAARTNQGKSWLLYKSAAAAVEQGLRVGIYSGEMSENKVAYRIDTWMSHISNTGLTKGKREYQNQYKQYLDQLPTKYPTACCKVLTPSMIGGPAGATALRAFIEKEKLDILFIDQHSLLEDDRNAKNPVEKASNISKDLKNLQVLKQIPIITVCQQNRASTENGVGTEHIAQSDRISQDSTVIIFFEQDKDHKLLTLNLVKSRDSANMKKLQYQFDFDKGILNYLPTEDEDTPDIPSNDTEALRNQFEYGDRSQPNIL